jgi:predicted acylesterase/phospholipase RssA
VHTGKRLLDYFDLIAGTSTGGIIALGLGLGLPAAHIRDFYIREGPRIFPTQGRAGRLAVTLRRWFRRGYDPGPLEAALKTCLGYDTPLGASRTRLVIPAFDAERADVYLFKTAHHPRLRVDFRRPAWEVAKATAAAPTYFDMHLLDGCTQLVDGGMWANTPAMVALVDAIALVGVPLNAIRMLSVGTGFEPLSAERRHRRGGKAQWALDAVEFVMRGQAQAAIHQVELLIGKDRLVHVDPVVPPKRYALDRYALELDGLGRTEARQRLGQIEGLFLQTPRPDFVPFHSLETKEDQTHE